MEFTYTPATRAWFRDEFCQMLEEKFGMPFSAAGNDPDLAGKMVVFLHTIVEKFGDMGIFDAETGIRDMLHPLLQVMDAVRGAGVAIDLMLEICNMESNPRLFDLIEPLKDLRKEILKGAIARLQDRLAAAEAARPNGVHQTNGAANGAANNEEGAIAAPEYTEAHHHDEDHDEDEEDVDDVNDDDDG